MRYDISKATAPAMPNLGKGTESIRHDGQSGGRFRL